MNEVVEFKILKNDTVWLKFKDSYSNSIDLKPFINKGLNNTNSKK